jgi:hypothetical protein
MRIGNQEFREVWAVDFEFAQPSGETPSPICLVAWELGSGRKIRLWQDEMRDFPRPPYATDDGALFVAYYASAEIGCHLALGWPVPVNVLDLYVEFRNLTNGKDPLWGASLIGALTWFGIDSMDAVDKDTMRQLAMRGGPYSDEEKEALLNYCESDVAALAKLIQRMIEEGRIK